MAQHFLLTAKTRQLSIAKLFKMSDDEALELFASIRWKDNNGLPVCPACNHKDKIYTIKSRNQYRCADCDHTFSVTSNTVFANRKLPLQHYLVAIALFTNAVKSLSALQLSRDLDCQYKTAWVIIHKIRESLVDNSKIQLDGVCEMDGVYVNHYIRPANSINDRIDRKKALTPNKRVIISIRQRHDELRKGAKKTLTFVLKSENSQAIRKLTLKHIKLGSQIHTDEATAYDDLHAFYDMKRVNHQVEYSSKSGASNNQCESYNSRFRRMQIGQVHKIDNKYLDIYANEIAYREDTRRWSNGKIFNDILLKCANSPVSHDFSGYWQLNKRFEEKLSA
jgi:transposase-like protein